MPTSTAKIFNPRVRLWRSPARTRHNGFSLLEVMIVVGIIAAVAAFVLPKLGGQNSQMRQAVRRLSTLTRQLQSTAKLQGVVYRLVFDLKEGAGGKSVPQYWVEKGSARTILTPEEMEDKPLEGRKDEEDKPKPMFEKDEKLLKTTELPNLMRIEDVEIKRLDKPITSGKAYIYFFPQGLVDESVIHLRGGEKAYWTLVIEPLTGKTNVLPEKVSLKELTEK